MYHRNEYLFQTWQKSKATEIQAASMEHIFRIDCSRFYPNQIPQKFYLYLGIIRCKDNSFAATFDAVFCIFRDTLPPNRQEPTNELPTKEDTEQRMILASTGNTKQEVYESVLRQLRDLWNQVNNKTIQIQIIYQQSDHFLQLFS